MGDFDEADMAGKARDAYMHVATAYFVVVLLMQFLERVWPWSRKRLENVPHYDP